MFSCTHTNSQQHCINMTKHPRSLHYSYGIFLANFKPTFFRRSRKPQPQEKYSSSLKKVKQRILSIWKGKRRSTDCANNSTDIWVMLRFDRGNIFIFAHACLKCPIFYVMYCSCVFLHRSPSVIQSCGGGQEVEFSLFTASVNRTQLLKCNNP